MAFEQLFLPYGKEVTSRVRQHHEAHCGVSRYEKIPIYLKWAGEPVTENLVRDFCLRFSDLARQAVVDSSWVPGVCEYLATHHKNQCFVLVTATPQDEILQILHSLELFSYFREIYGAPISKATAIRDVLQRLKLLPEQALMVGDSESDLNAAKENNVTFLLRKTMLNRTLQQQYTGPMFEDLTHE